jgi:hypothetical protein
MAVGVFWRSLIPFKGIHNAGLLMKNGISRTTCHKQDGLKQSAGRGLVF